MPFTAGQKIQAMRASLKALADKQPTHNIVKTWALEGAEELPALALQELCEAMIDHIGEGP